jgi:hypothetical protein
MRIEDNLVNRTRSAWKEEWARADPDRPLTNEVRDPDFRPKSTRRKLLDDTESLLYCDPEFDRQIGIGLS